jgi:hypothetical protein
LNLCFRDYGIEEAISLIAEKHWELDHLRVVTKKIDQNTKQLQSCGEQRLIHSNQRFCRYMQFFMQGSYHIERKFSLATHNF